MNHNPKKTQQDHLYLQNFEYGHQNPYHERLKAFSHFVYRDKEGEEFKGRWGQSVFQENSPLHVEIGSGYGHFLMNYAQNNPHLNLIGLDYRFKRSFKLVEKIEKNHITNIRFLRARAERLHYLFAPDEISELYYFFPDPWPRNRQKKKRLFQMDFLKNAHLCLKDQAKFMIKTDHRDYFEWMLKHLELQGGFVIEEKSFDLHKDLPGHFLTSYQTKFESLFLKQNLPIHALVLRKEGPFHVLN